MLGQGTPVGVAVLLNVGDEAHVLLRRPGPFLQPLPALAAGRPPHGAGAPPAPVEKPSDPDEPDNPRPETIGWSLEETDAGLADPSAMASANENEKQGGKHRWRPMAQVSRC